MTSRCGGPACVTFNSAIRFHRLACRVAGHRAPSATIPRSATTMTRRRQILLIAVPSAALAVAGWVGFRVWYTLSHVHEAYAAWDTGTLLVAYMESHDDRWPSSWPELLTVLDSASGQRMELRGAQAGDLAYARALRDLVAVDWRFDPARPATDRPVTRPDGTGFPVWWQDPNEMVRQYLRQHSSTRRSGPVDQPLMRTGPRSTEHHHYRPTASDRESVQRDRRGPLCGPRRSSTSIGLTPDHSASSFGIISPMFDRASIVRSTPFLSIRNIRGMPRTP